MIEAWSSQYQMPCVDVNVMKSDATSDDVVRFARQIGAVREVDGEEFCVALRDDVGPELWTEEALRLSVDRKRS